MSVYRSQYSDSALGWTILGSIPGKVKEFFSSQKKSRPDLEPSLLFNAYRGSSQGINRPGRDVDHLHPSGAELNNEWSYASALPIFLHGVDRVKYCNNRYIFVMGLDLGSRICI